MLTVEPFKTLSYWDRRGVARHMGQTGVYDATKFWLVFTSTAE
jgi:hypothetical protein